MLFFLLYTVTLFFWRYPAISARKLSVHKEYGLILNYAFFYLVPVFIISLIIGLRYDVGVDYLAYKGLYETSFTGTIDESWGNLEFLYAIISYCCYKLGMPYYVLFMIMAFIPFYFYYKSFDRFRYLFSFCYLLLDCFRYSILVFQYSTSSNSFFYFVILSELYSKKAILDFSTILFNSSRFSYFFYLFYTLLFIVFSPLAANLLFFLPYCCLYFDMDIFQTFARFTFLDDYSFLIG